MVPLHLRERFQYRKKEIQDNKKKAVEWAKEKIKAEQEKKDEVQKQLLAEQQKNKQAEKKYEKKYKDHFASLSDSKIKAAKQKFLKLILGLFLEGLTKVHL